MAEVIPAEFARMCGVAPSVISRKIKNGTLIRNSAGMLDTENPVNSRYSARRRIKSNQEALEDTGNNVEKALKKGDFSAFDDYEIEKNAGIPRKLLGMTIRELVVKFKGIEGMERYIKSLKDLTIAEAQDQKTQERRLQLVEKDFVVSHVFAFNDFLLKQLLEFPESIVDEAVALVMSEGLDARSNVRNLIVSGAVKIIKGAKAQILDNLSTLAVKYQKEDSLNERLDRIEEKLEENSD
jgi:AmiR/NasT family two-component response regulator